MADEATIRDVAFYYPGHLWRHSEWIKTLLLFFDGIGLLVPEYKQGEPETLDPVLAAPPRDRGLLHKGLVTPQQEKFAPQVSRSLGPGPKLSTLA
jgi:hypothetical protein